MSALALVLLGLLGARWWAAQDLLCAQTDAISDACYSLGVGHRPSREERLAWAKVSPRDCYDLKLFLRKYPSGVLAGRAEAAMVAPRVHWARRTTHLEGHVGEGATFPSKRGAAADSLRRADGQVDHDCVAPTGARGRAAGVLIIDYATPPRYRRRRRNRSRGVSAHPARSVMARDIPNLDRSREPIAAREPSPVGRRFGAVFDQRRVSAGP